MNYKWIMNRIARTGVPRQYCFFTGVKLVPNTETFIFANGKSKEHLYNKCSPTYNKLSITEQQIFVVSSSAFLNNIINSFTTCMKVELYDECHLDMYSIEVENNEDFKEYLKDKVKKVVDRWEEKDYYKYRHNDYKIMLSHEKIVESELNGKSDVFERLVKYYS